MKERPILFSAPMVRAILEGRKTMTRRVIKDGTKRTPQYMNREKLYNMVNTLNDKPFFGAGFYKDSDVFEHEGKTLTDAVYFKCPYGKPSDRLWVRETFTYDNKEYVQTYKDEPWRGTPDPETAETYYRATGRDPDIFPRWRPSIFMPRWASRITLEITNIRVERLQDISEDDALSEGILEEENVIIGATCAGGQHRELYGNRYSFEGGKEEGYEDPISAFQALWESINGSESWQANPWVWVVEFKRV